MKILYVDLKYDYGVKERGLNTIGEYGIRMTFLKLHHEVETFYYDEHIKPLEFVKLSRCIFNCRVKNLPRV